MIGSYVLQQLTDLEPHHREPTWWLEASYRKLAQLGSVCMNRNSNSSRRHSLRSWKQICSGEESQTLQSHPCPTLSAPERDHGPSQPCPGAVPSLLSLKTTYLVPDVLA